MQRAADLLPLPPPALAEGGAKHWVLPGPQNYAPATRNTSTPLPWTAFTPAKAPSLKSHTHIPMERRVGMGTAWLSSHGVAASPAAAGTRLGQLEHSSAGSASVAGTGQFRHIPPSVCPGFCLSPGQFFPWCNAVAEEPKAPSPLSLARALQIPARLMGRAKTRLWICFLQVYFVCQSLKVMSGERMWISNCFSNLKHRSHIHS